MYRLHRRTQIPFLNRLKTMEIRVADRATCSSLAARHRAPAMPLRQNVGMTAIDGARARAIPPGASPEEAAAIIAAIEYFMRATAPAGSQSATGELPDGWRRAALLEGTSRTSQDEDVAWMSPAPG